MSNDTSETETDRTQDDSQVGGENEQRSGDRARERMAWGLFVLLTIYVSMHWAMPNYAPDPGIAGTIAGTLVTLLTVRALRGGGVA